MKKNKRSIYLFLILVLSVCAYTLKTSIEKNESLKVSNNLINSEEKNNFKSHKKINRAIASQLFNNQKKVPSPKKEKQIKKNKKTFFSNDNYSEDEVIEKESDVKSVGQNTERITASPVDHLSSDDQYQIESQNESIHAFSNNDSQSESQTFGGSANIISKGNKTPNDEDEEKAIVKKGGSGGTTQSPNIYGIVYPLKTPQVTSNHSSGELIISSAHASGCSSTASLYEIDEETMLPAMIPLMSVPVQEDATFNMEISRTDVNGEKPNHYILRVSGCDQEYSRLVTSFYSQQNISVGTTLLAKVLEVHTAKNIFEIKSEDLNEITNKINIDTSSFEEIFDQMKMDSSLESKFQATFGDDVTILTNTKPVVQEESITLIVNEKTNTPFSLQSAHWYSNYNTVHEWYIDDHFYITGNSFIYTPGANDQGLKKIKILIGRNDGSGRVNKNLSFETREWNVSVIDTSPVMAPSFELNNQNLNPVLSDSFKVNINTGVNFANCESFSSMAISETPFVPEKSQFVITCLNQAQQIVNVDLANLSDGAKKLYLWSMDSAGNISSVPSEIAYRKDTSLPSGSLENIVGVINGGRDYMLNFTSFDANEVASLVLEYSKDDGVTFSQIASLLPSVTNYQWVVPTDSTTEARVRLIVRDGASKETIYSTSKFTIDVAVPQAPVYTLETPLLTNLSLAKLTINSCTGTTHILLNDGTVPQLNDSEWVACSTLQAHYTYDLGSSEGVKTFAIWAKNDVNRISASSVVNVTLDTTSPNAPLLSLDESFITNNTATKLTSTNCTDTPYLLFNQGQGPQASESGWISCSTLAGAYSYTLAASEGSSSFFVWSKDAAQNISASATKFDMIYDITAPTHSLTNLNSVVRGSSAASLIFSSSDLNGIESNQLEYSINSGAFILIAANASSPYAWTIPSGNHTNVQLRLTTKDKAQNTKVSTSSMFAIDSTPPSAPAVDLASHYNTNSNTALITVTSCSDIGGIFINTGTLPGPDDAGWMSCSTNIGNYSYNFPAIQGVRNISVWAKDSVGNISSASTVSVNYDTTKPASPAIVRNSPAISNLSKTIFSATSCSDTPYLLFNNSSKPLASDSGWKSCSTAANSFEYSIATIEGEHEIKVWSKDYAGNVSDLSTDFKVIFDVTNPATTLNDLASIIRGGDTVAIAFSGSDLNGISSAVLEFSQNGSTYTELAQNPTSPYSWSVPSINSANSKIRYTVTDQAGNIAVKITTPFSVDSTAPSALAITLHSSLITSSATIQFSLASCADSPFIYFSENILAPQREASEWTSCSNVAGDMSYVLVGPISEGIKTIYAYAKDAVGNISPSVALSVTYDTVAPSVNLATVLSGTYRGGSHLNLNFSASDLSGLNSYRLEYASDGSTYTTVANFLSSDTTYSWTLPQETTNQAKLRLNVTDKAIPANATFVESATFSIDSTPPSAAVATLFTSVYTKSRNIALSIASCSDFAGILINEGSAPNMNDSAWTACSTVPGAITYTLTNTEGAHAVKVWTKDAVGNVSLSAATVNVTYDITAPVLAFSNLRNLKVDESFNVNFTLTEINASSTQSIVVSFFNGTTTAITNVSAHNGPLNNRTYSASLLAPSTDNVEMEVKVAFTDLAGNSSEITQKIYSDLNPPVINSISLNEGAVLTQMNNIQVALSASDSVSNITHFCLKYNNQVQPDENASCWVNVNAPAPGVTPSKNISFSNYFFQIGFTNGLYDIYAWVKDEAGRISTNAASVGVDYANITFNSGTPPEIKFASATNSDIFKESVDFNDLTIPSGTPLYVKWSAEDVEGLASNPISVKYSTDDINFQDLAGGQNLINGQNGSCWIEPGKMTGCARLVSPTSGYFKLRIIAKDTLGTAVDVNTTPLNETKMRIIAGNTEHGLNSSARTAIYYMHGSYSDVSYGAKKKLAVSEDGKIFYLDKNRGLLWIDPSNGILKTFINETGTSSGNGGPVSAASLRSVMAISMDHQNNLLIWDYNEIRKVNLTTMVISHMIGGGATATPATTIPESSLSLPASFSSKWGTLIPLPNGDLIFSNQGSLINYRYRAGDQKIERMEMQGVGIFGYESDSWSSLGRADFGIIYDSTTSEIKFMTQQHYKNFTGDSYAIASFIDPTSGDENNPYLGNGPHTNLWNLKHIHDGLNGKLYLMNRFKSSLEYYDHQTKQLVRVLGTGTLSGNASATPCPDTTLATSCAVNLDSTFISKSGRIYFVDNGLIRTIDDNNRVITLLGQYSSYGDGVLASTARFGSFQDLALGVDSDTIVVEDGNSNSYREFKIDGNIQTLGSACYSQTGPASFDVDRRTGDIFAPCGGTLRRLNRANLTLSTVVGGGSTRYYEPAAVGLTGNQINVISGYNSPTVGIIGSKVFWMKYYWEVGINKGCSVRSYDMDDSYRQGHVASNASLSCVSGGFTLGTNLSSQNASLSDYSKFRYFTDPSDSVTKYFFTKIGGSKIYKSDNFGAVQEFVTLTKPINGFTYATRADGLNLYYCSTDGSLYKYVYNTGVTTKLEWTSPTTKCVASRNLIYNEERNTLIFGISQNSLFGVAEYLLD